MKGKAVFILLVLCLFLFSCIFVACTKKPEKEPFKKPDTTQPTTPQLTPEEKAKKAIEPFVQILKAAIILEEPAKLDDPKYTTQQYKDMVAIRDKIAAGTTIEQLAIEKPFGAVVMGPYPNVKPADIHGNLVTLLNGVEPGKTSKILFAEGQGYGMVFLKAKDAATGNVEVAVILISVPAATTTQKPPEQGATKTETGKTGTTPAPPPKKGP
jgi:hypothetical protein